jgi:hypothetical protein
MLRKQLLLAALAVTLLSIHGLAQGNAPLLPPNHINPNGLSQGAQMWWFGSNLANKKDISRKLQSPKLRSQAGKNVDAANPNEDVAPGQAETAIAAAGNLVMASWNDATGLFIEPTTNPIASSFTGVGFSSNGGKAFTDLGGLPNFNPNMKWFGDPSVVAVDNGAYFVVSSLYLPVQIDCSVGPAAYDVAVSVGTVTPNGVEFTNPIVVASGGDYCSPTGPTALLDKDFMSYDPHTRTLAVSYTRFTFFGFGFGSGQIEVATAHLPTSVAELSSADFSAPIVVWPEEFNVENEGAYPVVAYNSATKAADIYVAWERNWASNTFNGDPYVYIHAAQIVSTSTGPEIIGGPDNPVVVTEGQLNSNAYGGVKSLDLVVVPGYNRGTSNDFPRIAWDANRNQVVIVWNDASHHPLGDIFLRAFDAGLTSPGGIEKLNLDNTGTLHMFPAVCFRSDGDMVTSWYDRRDFVPDSAWTDLFGDIRSSPYAKGKNFKITTTPTDWANTSSIIGPNFGDYTDNACSGTAEFFTWTDGRLGYSQPFVSP